MDIKKKSIIICMIKLTAVVLPVLFIVIVIFGHGQDKYRSALLLFLYTLAGSLPMLLSILTIYNYIGSTDFQLLSLYEINIDYQKVLWLGFFVGFAVKTPLYPFIIWLPKAHADSVLAGSILLAATILKLATYGYMRVLINFLPDATHYFSPLVQTICIITILYSSFSTIVQQDTKRLIAYSSIAHMGVVVLGLFSNTIQGIEGAILLSIAHGFVSPALFICVGGIIYDRTHTRIINYLKGLVSYMPVFTILFFVFTLANTGIPLTLNFLGEQMSLLGIFERNPITAVLGATSIVTSACYSLFLYNRLSYGSYSIHLSILKDINRREFFLLFALLIPTILLGIFPNVILDTLHISVTSLLYEIPSSTPIDLISNSSLLILVTKSKLKNTIKDKLFKFNYISRYMANSSTMNNQTNNRLDTSEEMYNALRENLFEIKKHTFPSNHLTWHDDGWKTMIDQKLDKKWDDLRGLYLKNINKKEEGLNLLDTSDNRDFNNLLKDILNKQKINDININENEANILIDKLNPVFNDYRNKLNQPLLPDNSISKNKIITFDSVNEKFIIDLEESKNLISNILEFMDNNKEKINFTVESLSIGLGAGFLYKSIVSAYSKSMDSTTATDNFKSLNESDKKKFLELITNKKSSFNKGTGVVITFLLFGMIQVIRSNYPIAMKVGISSLSDTPSNPSSEDIKKSLLFPLLKNKKFSKWIKNLIILILFLMFSYIMLYKVSFFSFKLIRLFILLVNSLFVIYNLNIVFILIKNLNNNNKDMNVPKYYPSYLKKHILFLMNINDINLSKLYMHIYVINAIYSFYLLLLTVFINIILVDFIKFV
jgi:NADH-ubiquinone oxidoreductase chain 4